MEKKLADEGGKPAAADDKFRVSAPQLSLPKGGGAVRGMGEKFAANPVTGTGSMSVPIATSPGRSGFGPQLTLTYDSGAGNGIFGLGWNLTLPAISRKTDKGLPRYFDAEESDVYILSGAEDLVPVLNKDGTRFVDTTLATSYTIHRYRPRIEGLFARIERWTSKTDSKDVFWRSISRDNITTWYGKTTQARIANPEDASQIFSWLICESYDDKGNAIVYEYAAENSDNIVPSLASERNRSPASRAVNRHLKRIKYGNKTSRLIEPDLAKLDWHFQVVFDYGENHYRNVSADGADPYFIDAWSEPPKPENWPQRVDPISTYRSGFEVRTYRLCRRVLMFHDFDELGSTPCLVSSTDFHYEEGPVASFIAAVSHSGYDRQRDASKAFTDRYRKKSLPPLEFTYSKIPNPAEMAKLQVEDIDAASLENLPIGLDGQRYQWIDLDGEGISGVLSDQPGAWYYKDNLGNGRFGAAQPVIEIPSLAAPGGKHQLLDLAGDGQLDVVLYDSPTSGFYERTTDASWEPFRSFASLPNIAWNDPNLKFVDLTGDGHADLVISEDQAFVWYPSLAEEGFAPAERVAQALDEEQGPHLVFADATQSIYLSDMSGDGLTDIVRIRNGEICYWPNLGYGRFGAKVTMDNAPWFDTPDLFSQERIRLADVDGSGVTDIIYLGHDGVRIYYNQSGNGWSAAATVPQFPRVDHLSSVQVLDFLGTGTACLVWSSPLPGDARRPLRYIDLMGGQKPHLLAKTINNLGAETVVHYAPSTKFYLEDKRQGKTWITKLPFPVHVVERVETFDRISNNRFATRYAYHHGYFDGVEREFRGFGMVEQWDTEAFTALSKNDTFLSADNIDAASHVPPVHTKTWFHTGVYLGRDRVSKFFAGLLDDKDSGEYYPQSRTGDTVADTAAKALLLDDTILPPGLTLDEEREACRALKGSMLRQEVYALDGSNKQEHPYTVTEQNFTIECLQAIGDNRHAVFLAHPREALSYHYERNPADPRVSHALALEVDHYGNVRKSLAIGYGRTLGLSPLKESADKANQEQTLITYTENDVTNAIDDSTLYPNDYRAPLPCEARTYEVTWLPSAVRFSFNDFAANKCQALLALPEISYEQPTDFSKQQKRLIECVRTLYRKDDLSALLGKGTLQPHALPGESYKLAFTPGLLKQVYVRGGVDLLAGKPGDILNGGGGDHGGYLDLDGDGSWWIPSGRMFFSPGNGDNAATELAHALKHFFLPHRYRDPFYTATWNTEATVRYDGYNLLVEETRDAVGNTVSAAHDYRVLQAQSVTDPNGNRVEAAFDALGMVVATAVMGKVGEQVGDLLEDVDPDPTLAALQAFMVDPYGQAPALLGKATSRTVYDLHRFQRCGQPPVAATLARETHFYDDGGPTTKIQISFSYSDGFGREIQKKIQAEPGDAPQRAATVTLPSGDSEPGALTLDGSGKPVPAVAKPRWVGNGRTVFNNKGKPVRQYEPFFSATHLYEKERELTDTGVSPILFYDPVDRVVATLRPDHTYEKVVFNPWQQTTFDVNDTVTANGPETGDPRTDKDVAGYVAAYFQTQPAGWKTWFQQRITGAKGTDQQTAAQKAANHTNTPSTAHADALGRAFLTFADNGPDPATPGQHVLFATHVELDIEGNQRAVVDANNRVVMTYAYDMLGNRIHQASMEAGERWMLNDITGKPLRGWNRRKYEFHAEYDVLRRPLQSLVAGGDSTEPNAKVYPKVIVTERTIYGDSADTGLNATRQKAANLRGKVFKHFDSAGVTTTDWYDFKGNSLRSQRQVASDYKDTPDWSKNPALDETFDSSTTYDALNRPTAVTAPDKSIYLPTFNEGNLLDKVQVKLRGAASATDFVTNIDYDAKGQRTRIEYGNKAVTAYEYDEQTFRLTQLKTTRAPGQNGDSSKIFKTATVVQDLAYTYDPAGNITRIADAALQQLTYNNQKVDPACDYRYDALYRLVEATGREQIGQTAFRIVPTNGSLRDMPYVGPSNGGDLQAQRNYTQQYQYDAVGNFINMIHQAANGGWTRDYEYNEPSQIDPLKRSNRLSKTTIGATTEIYSNNGNGYDAHGNMLNMPHLFTMQWDFRDQMIASSRQAVTAGTAETTYYVYDAAGQRARKVTERQNGTRKSERIYLGGYEIFREYDSTGANPELVRETLHVMDDKQRIALVETRTVENGKDVASPQPVQRYQLGNHLGSASVELDQDGGLISYEEYHPYGTAAFQVVKGGAEVSLKRYRYTGKERDEESGLYYHGARYYAAWFGRWTSCDPLGIATGFDAYVYSASSPVCLRDIDGLAPNHPQDIDTKQPWIEGVSPAQSGSSPPQTSQSAPAKSPAPKKGEGQLYLSESKGHDFEAKATGKGRGFSKQHRAYGMEVVRLWGGPKRYDLAHRGKPHVDIKQGETFTAGIGERTANRTQSAAERATGGVRSGARGADPTAAPGARNVQPKPPPIQSVNPKSLEVHAPPPPPPAVPKVEPPKFEAPKVEAPMVESPKVKTAGMSSKGVGPKAVGTVAGVLGVALVAGDLYKAKNNDQRMQIVENTPASTVVLGGVAEIPVAGPWIAAGVAGLGLGVGVGTVLSEDVIPDSTQAAYGKVIAESGFGATTDDIELLENFEIGGWRPFAP